MPTQKLPVRLTDDITVQVVMYDGFPRVVINHSDKGKLILSEQDILNNIQSSLLGLPNDAVPIRPEPAPRKVIQIIPIEWIEEGDPHVGMVNQVCSVLRLYDDGTEELGIIRTDTALLSSWDRKTGEPSGQ